VPEPTWPGGSDPTLPGGADPTRIYPSTPPVARSPGPVPPLPPAPPGPPGRSTPRASRPGGARTAIGVVLLFVTGLSVVGAVTASWTRTQIRDEDTWAATAQVLADDPQVQQSVADTLAEQVMAVTGAEDLIQGVLPGALGALADPLTEQATELVSSVTLQLVQTDAFRQAWESAVRASHQELIAALDGDGRYTTISSEGVELDLGSTLGQLRQMLSDRGLTFLDDIDLSQIDVQFLLVDAPDIDRLRDVLEVLDRLAVVLPIVAVATGLVGLLVARRRSWAVVGAGMGMLVGVGAVWLVTEWGRGRATDELTGGGLGPAAVEAAVEHVNESLAAVVAGLAVAGVVVLVLGAGAAALTARRS
jgi:hypothetical protein